MLVFSSWSESPERALAEAIAEAAGIGPGSLLDVATRAQADRDVYLVLDQAEEYFTYHPDGDGFDRALADLVDGPLRVNVLLSLREDTLATLDRLKGSIPNLFGNVLRLDRLDRDSGRAAIVKPLDRWEEPRARPLRSRTRSSPPCSTGWGPAASSSAPAVSARTARTVARRGSRRRTSSSSCRGCGTSSGRATP